MSAGSIFFLIIVWNIKKPDPKYIFYPSVSLMAYAWQSGNIIERKIQNFLSQDYPKDKCEVIIYDNDSTDETEAICRRYEKQGLIKYYRAKQPYDRKSPVLDQAIAKVAQGEIIALTDPDGVCEKDWVKKIVQPFVDPKVGAAVGVIHCGNYHKNLFTKLRAIEDEWWYHISVLGRDGKRRISDFTPICGANYALSKTAWESVGRSHGTSLIEDYEMTLRLYNKGWRIAPTDAHVWQEEVEDVGAYIRQRRRWYSSNLTNLIQGIKKKNKILGALPISMQAVSFFSLVYFASLCAYYTATGELTFGTLFFIIPFSLTYLSLISGLIKVGMRRLLPYTPLSLTFDNTLQMLIFLETKLRFKKERHWLKLAKGKYYHAGTEIRTD